MDVPRRRVAATLRRGRSVETARRRYYPGDIGFDPAGLKPTDPTEFAEMATKELQNGRLAMIAIAGFVAQELVNGQSILG